ncbi:GH116 family glycosyl hydrolase [Sphingobacterium cellulitidis]|uniref:Uncharacterized protein n=1 Tax=Sphingobacterium cellulitidis TaxID=1768011 RepID=A0A8H9FZP8_9SPHI|nr:GH116 family glycosyl hydrolase [Sphingobacterium soli]MBA8987028.1 uncharacterized protein (DUF608 family) [Sphingobacterium soli]GGE15782.1 hypothetical protein GCM10011516_11950 [Sphingobacterium soli]
MNRRNFLKNSSLLGLGVFASQFPVWGRSIFSWDAAVHNIPIEKGYSKEWIKSLYGRGEKIQYKKSLNELKYIGMPVGGLHSGTVYISGDGRLWLWQVFNTSYDGLNEGVENKVVLWDNGREMQRVRPRDGAAFVEPALSDNLRILEQGFLVSVKRNGKVLQKVLEANQWDEVIFEPSYPTCKVLYSSASFPVDVELTAFSPFIPLDEDNSSLPLTTFHIEIKNKNSEPLEVEVIGWFENGVHKGRKDFDAVKKLASVKESNGSNRHVYFECDSVPTEFQKATDHGNMAFMAHDGHAKIICNLESWPVQAENLQGSDQRSLVDFKDLQISSISSKGKVEGNGKKDFQFSVAWYFNNPHPKLQEHLKDAKEGYWYGKRFKDASEVLNYYAAHLEELDRQTMKWVQTWNDSTLPYWFLDRTFVNIGSLATANTMRFGTGRFWGWEGVGACAGTCTHVWQYGQAMGRIFPGLERNLRETTDYGVGFNANSGAIIFRAEYESRPAIDGQAGVILRTYRDHQTSKDDTFLKKNWPSIKKASQFILNQDKNGDGMTDTPMENTLDAVWEGEIAWIVGLSLAAIKAAEKMANEVGDLEFEKKCASYFSKGSKNMDSQLFNGEYYIHRPNKEFGRKKLGSYNTCHIDQVYGQAWTFQLGLPRVNDKAKTLSALQALWKYNYAPDVGPYIKTHLQGRPYAIAGDAGMVMNTNPKNEKHAYGENETWQLGYFHECMTGFEHQVAAHMMAEGMIDESMILTRKIHERYHASKRNPFNEIECSDHYARAMASYGTFINACGFTYHGPKKQIGFHPKINPENFKAAFTAADGWGSYTQKISSNNRLEAIIDLANGNLEIAELTLPNLKESTVKSKVTAKIGNSSVSIKNTESKNDVIIIVFDSPIVLSENKELLISIS